MAKSFNMSDLSIEFKLELDFRLEVSDAGGKIAFNGLPSIPWANSWLHGVNSFALICFKK